MSPSAREPQVLSRMIRTGSVFVAPIALAAFVLAARACTPAAACSHAGAADKASASAPATRLESKFDWPGRGTIVIAARDGAEVRAAQSGLVVFAGTFKSHGNVVLVRHADGVVSAVYGDIG